MEESKENVNELFICQCHSIDHQLVFSYDKDWDEVFVSVYLKPEPNIFKRMVIAIKYIFGYKSIYGPFDEFIFKKSDAERLQEVVNHLRK